MTAARRPPETLRVDLGDRGYDIIIGPGAIDDAGARIKVVAPSGRAVIVTDENVARLHGARLAAALDKAGLAHERLVLPPGEATKNFTTLGALIDDLLALGVERRTPVVALGGGVIGDIAGLAASLALRGLPFVQIPTTLLAQVDSSVGGKTAVDSPRGKNLIGAFYQPRLVIADLATLKTLPPREIQAGYAEIVKYGVIADAAFFAWLEKNGANVLRGDVEALTRAVVTSCRLKAAIVADDERESGRRMLLNMGHTFAHAFETASGYGDALLHGEAVAMGMAAALRLSARLGLAPEDDVRRLDTVLAAAGLALKPGARTDVSSWSPAALIALMSQDKKVSAGKLAFVLSRGIGDAVVSREVPKETLEAILAEAIRS